jgi:peptidyl-prolyl cis-trans isomerase D
VLANAKLLDAVLRPTRLKEAQHGRGGGGANQLVARAIETPAHTLPLDEVKAVVKARLVLEKAQAMAKDEGEKALAAWKAGTEGKLSAPVEVSRDKPAA